MLVHLGDATTPILYTIKATQMIKIITVYPFCSIRDTGNIFRAVNDTTIDLQYNLITFFFVADVFFRGGLEQPHMILGAAEPVGADPPC